MHKYNDLYETYYAFIYDKRIVFLEGLSNSMAEVDVTDISKNKTYTELSRLRN